MYSKILVPIDGSKPADKALDHAINLEYDFHIVEDESEGKDRKRHCVHIVEGVNEDLLLKEANVGGMSHYRIEGGGRVKAQPVTAQRYFANTTRIHSTN